MINNSNSKYNNNSDDESIVVKAVHRLSSMVRRSSLLCRSAVAQILFNWKILVLGQIYSLIVACGLGFGATLVFECNLSAPASMLCIYYLVQSFHLVFLFYPCPRLPIGRTHTSRKKSDEECASSKPLPENLEIEDEKHYFCKKIPIHISPWMYLKVAILHVEGNYFNLLALRYTTLTSISLIDGFAIPSALLFSMSLIRKRYRKYHIFGVILCLLGILTNFYGDVHKIHLPRDASKVQSEYQWPHLMLGDGFAFIGALLCGLSDVFNELILKEFKAPSNEYLGMIGIFGSIICFIQASIFEQDFIKGFFVDDIPTSIDTPKIIGEDIGIYRTCSKSNAWMYFVGSVIGTYLSYYTMCKFLKISEAALLNLSLITADFWSVGYVVLVQNMFPEPLFYVALLFTISGLLIYQSGPLPEETQHDFRTSNPLEDNSTIVKTVKK